MKRKADPQDNLLVDKEPKFVKIEAEVFRNALFKIFAVRNPSKSKVAACKSKVLQDFCSDLHLVVGTSGKRGGRVKQDYIIAITEYMALLSSTDAVEDSGDVEMMDENRPAISVQVRLFDHARDYGTCFISTCIYSCHPDGSINLDELAESLSLERGCQVIDPVNFHPLYAPDNIVTSHFVLTHLKRQGFIRVISN